MEDTGLGQEVYSQSVCELMEQQPIAFEQVVLLGNDTGVLVIISAVSRELLYTEVTNSCIWGSARLLKSNVGYCIESHEEGARKDGRFVRKIVFH